MLRKTYLLMFVLLFIGSDPAVARHGRFSFRHRRCVSACCSPCERRIDFYCLQDLYLDYPGDDDVYLCITNEGDCPNPDAYEDLWYGNPVNPAPGPPPDPDPPQVCDGTSNNCEYGSAVARCACPPPGHCECFTRFVDTIDWIRDKIPGHPGPSELQPKYYRFWNPCIGTVYTVIVKMPCPGNHYFGVETRQLVDATPTIRIPTVLHINQDGTVLSIMYHDGGVHNALI